MLTAPSGPLHDRPCPPVRAERPRTHRPLVLSGVGARPTLNQYLKVAPSCATIGAMAAHTSWPPAVAWSPERDARGASPAPRTPRCLVKGCIVRYASGPDRLCPWHADEDEAQPAVPRPGPYQWRGQPGDDEDDGPWHD